MERDLAEMLAPEGRYGREFLTTVLGVRLKHGLAMPESVKSLGRWKSVNGGWLLLSLSKPKNTNRPVRWPQIHGEWLDWELQAIRYIRKVYGELFFDVNSFAFVRKEFKPAPKFKLRMEFWKKLRDSGLVEAFGDRETANSQFLRMKVSL